MESGKVYVISLGNNVVESMTKEQIIAAIAEATGETPTHIDDAFITKLQEQNRNRNLKVWVGTQAEYAAIATPASDTLYVITDANEYEDLDARLTSAEGDIGNLQTDVETLQANAVIEQGTVTDADNATWDYRKWEDGTVECWIGSKTNIPLTSIITFSGDLKLFTCETNLPPIFTSVKAAMADVGLSSVGGFLIASVMWAIYNPFQNKTTMRVDGITNAGSQATSSSKAKMQIYAIGRWKE